MKRLFKILSALKTGIWLLVIITVCSIVGVVIPQGLESQRYLAKWGSVAGSLLVSIGLDHLFSTLWYNILLGIFSLNVLLCTINRIRASAVSLFRPGFLTADRIASLPLHAAAQGDGSVKSAVNYVSVFCKKRRFTVAVSDSGETVLIDARKGALREIGMALLHLSLLPLLIGGLVGKMAGFSYQEMLGTGETVAVRERPFFVRCDYFELERNEKGAIKDYKSKLTLLDSSGGELVSKVIEVNHPLVYRGIKFYQSSYGSDPMMVDSIQLVVRGTAVGPMGKRIIVHPGMSGRIQGTDLWVAVHQFIPDFWIDMETRTPKSRSMQHNNPAFLVSVTNSTDTLFFGWVFQKFGSMHHESDSCSVVLMNYGQQYATGLLIKENPGGPAIWAGILFMTIGVLLVFWIQRRRMRFAVISAENGVKIIAGSSRLRNDPEAETYFIETVSVLAKEMNFSIKETTANAIN